MAFVDPELNSKGMAAQVAFVADLRNDDQRLRRRLERLAETFRNRSADVDVYVLDDRVSSLESKRLSYNVQLIALPIGALKSDSALLNELDSQKLDRLDSHSERSLAQQRARTLGAKIHRYSEAHRRRYASILAVDPLACRTAAELAARWSIPYLICSNVNPDPGLPFVWLEELLGSSQLPPIAHFFTGSVSETETALRAYTEIRSQNITSRSMGIETSLFPAVEKAEACKLLSFHDHLPILTYRTNLLCPESLKRVFRVFATLLHSTGIRSRLVVLSESTLTDTAQMGLQRLAEEFRVINNVHFALGVNQVFLPYYLSASDITLLIDEDLDHEMLALESLACGTPPLTFNSSSRIEALLSPVSTELLLPPVTATELERRITSLLLSPRNLRSMRELARKHVKDFEAKTFVDEYMGVIDNEAIKRNVLERVGGIQFQC